MPSTAPSFSTWHSAQPIDLNSVRAALRADSSRWFAGVATSGRGKDRTNAVKASHSRRSRSSPGALIGGTRGSPAWAWPGTSSPSSTAAADRTKSRKVAVWAFQPNRPMPPSASRATRPLTCGQPGCFRRAAASIAASGIASIRPMPEQRGRVALRRPHRDAAVLAQDPLAPDPVIGVIAVAVQDHARRLAEARMDAAPARRRSRPPPGDDPASPRRAADRRCGTRSRPARS